MEHMYLHAPHSVGAFVIAHKQFYSLNVKYGENRPFHRTEKKRPRYHTKLINRKERLLLHPDPIFHQQVSNISRKRFIDRHNFK